MYGVRNPILQMIVGLILLTVGLGLWFPQAQMEVSGVETDAVIAPGSEKICAHQTDCHWFPHVSFTTASGQHVTTVVTNENSPVEPVVNTPVRIRYRPNHPQQVQLVGGNQRPFLIPMALTVGGAVWLILGCIGVAQGRRERRGVSNLL